MKYYENIEYTMKYQIGEFVRYTKQFENNLSCVGMLGKIINAGRLHQDPIYLIEFDKEYEGLHDGKMPGVYPSVTHYKKDVVCSKKKCYWIGESCLESDFICKIKNELSKECKI